jgi:hypothetical protein
MPNGGIDDLRVLTAGAIKQGRHVGFALTNALCKLTQATVRITRAPALAQATPHLYAAIGICATRALD